MDYIKIIKKRISKDELMSFLDRPFSEMIKFVVDTERRIIALGGEMHADAEQILLKDGSRQENLWGGNIYPKFKGEEKFEFTSLINIRPSRNNSSMEIEDDNIRDKVKKIAEELLNY